MGEVDGWIPDWFPKVEKEESRKWEPVDGIQEKITDGQTIIFLFFNLAVSNLLFSPPFPSRAR